MRFIASQMVILPTAAATNCTGPSGGVLSPMPRFRIMMTPKCTGSIPKFTTTGRKIGVVMMMSGAMSMKVPSTSRTMLIIRRMVRGSWLIAPIRSTVICATLR